MARNTPDRNPVDRAAVLEERSRRIQQALHTGLTERGYSRTETRAFPYQEWVVGEERLQLKVDCWTPQPEAFRAWERELSRNPEPVPFPTGPLQIAVKVNGARARRWSERPGPLEMQMDRILLRLEKLVANAAWRRDEYARSEKASRRAEQRLEHRLYREQVARDCWTGLRQLASDWEEAERIRRFLNAAEKSKKLSPDMLPKISWTRQRAEQLDPLSGRSTRIADLFAELAIPPPIEDLTDEDREYDRNLAEMELELPPICRLRPRKP